MQGGRQREERERKIEQENESGDSVVAQEFNKQDNKRNVERKKKRIWE